MCETSPDSGYYQLIDFDSCVMIGERTDEHIQPELYRAPEVILELKPYSCKIDVFGLGVILYELYTGIRMFAKQSNCAEQLVYLASLVGAPEQDMLDKVSDEELASKLRALTRSDDISWFPSADEPHTQLSCEFRDLVLQLLQCDPAQRPSATEALHHKFCLIERSA